MAESSERLWGHAGGWGHRRELPGSPLLLIKSTCESYWSLWSVCPCMGDLGTQGKDSQTLGGAGGGTGTASPPSLCPSLLPVTKWPGRAGSRVAAYPHHTSNPLFLTLLPAPIPWYGCSPLLTRPGEEVVATSSSTVWSRPALPEHAQEPEQQRWRHSAGRSRTKCLDQDKVLTNRTWRRDSAGSSPGVGSTNTLQGWGAHGSLLYPGTAPELWEQLQGPGSRKAAARHAQLECGGYLAPLAKARKQCMCGREVRQGLGGVWSSSR